MKEEQKSGLLWTIPFLIIVLFVLNIVKAQPQNSMPIAHTGSSRYAAQSPVFLDGTGSYDPDRSGPLSYTWRQISGPTVAITDANTATPTISGFVQTSAIQECNFELVVSDGELTSLPDIVKVVIVPVFGKNTLRLANDSFDPSKPTIVWFQGGDCIIGSPYQVAWDSDWLSLMNTIDFPRGFAPDSGSSPPTYYDYGDMIIVYLSSVAPDYTMPIQTIGFSTGGQPAVDVGIRLNITYGDARYAVNRVTLEDASTSCRDYEISNVAFITSSVDGEQCWLDNYVSQKADFYPNVLNVYFDEATDSSLSGLYIHQLPAYWYVESLSNSDMNTFNNGVVAGVYWSVAGPGKNLQLALTPGVESYKFTWYGDATSGYMDFYDEPNHSGRLPEPVTLVGPENGTFVDANGAVFSCEKSKNAIGYQLLFGQDPYRVMDYYIISDTPNPPTEVINVSPFEQTWWTMKVYDQHGSTIYADPIHVNFEIFDPPRIENITTGQRYASVRYAIDDARNRHEIVLSPGVYQEKINFKGKNLTLRSIDPNDLAIVSETVITADGDVVTFSGGEDAKCTLAGFTITGGKRGIYCSGASPTIINCTISKNLNAEIGAGMYLNDGSNPTLINCIFSENSASMMGGGIQNVNSNPILINCIFSGNSAAYFGGGIYCAEGSPLLTNCIIWGNIPEQISIYNGTPVITYSDIQEGFTGEGNINTDPLFADADNGDYHLKSKAGRWDPASKSWVIDDVTSPCIDAGDPSTQVSLEPLPNGGIINMGAYGGTSEASKSL